MLFISSPFFFFFSVLPEPRFTMPTAKSPDKTRRAFHPALPLPPDDHPSLSRTAVALLLIISRAGAAIGLRLEQQQAFGQSNNRSPVPSTPPWFWSDALPAHQPSNSLTVSAMSSSISVVSAVFWSPTVA